MLLSCHARYVQKAFLDVQKRFAKLKKSGNKNLSDALTVVVDNPDATDEDLMKLDSEAEAFDQEFKMIKKLVGNMKSFVEANS